MKVFTHSVTECNFYPMMVFVFDFKMVKDIGFVTYIISRKGMIMAAW